MCAMWTLLCVGVGRCVVCGWCMCVGVYIPYPLALALNQVPIVVLG